MSNVIKAACQEDEYSTDEVCHLIEKVKQHRFGAVTVKIVNGKVVTVETVETHKKK